MKKLLVILISTFVFLTSVACMDGRLAPAESGTVTTEEPLGSWWVTQEKIYPPIDKTIFDMIEIGSPASDYSELLSGYKRESHGHTATKYYCTDGGAMYVTYRHLYEADGVTYKSTIVYAVSPEFVEIKYDRKLIEEITVGMSLGEVTRIMGDRGIDVASGGLVSVYKLSDGGHAVIQYELDIEDDTWYVEHIDASNEDTDIF